jgi:type II secretory pathway predicted ATPase ExeA
MYEKFYGLTRCPFNLSPDPRFYYPTIGHNEALANLSYGIAKRKGFIVLTGEAGTGKTLLIRYLIEALIKAKVHYAYVFNPRLSSLDFLHYVVTDLGIKDIKSNRSALLLQFSQFLIEVYRRGSTAVLLVDEAQQLSSDLLEEIRLLTNIETSQQKLLQIVLVGQPELDTTLDSTELRQLKQRIALRCRLQPLDEAAVHGYIVRRLQLAGAAERAETIFPEASIQRILQYSRGIPRLINAICDSALVNGYARRELVVCPEYIEEVVNDLRLEVAPKESTDQAYNEAQRATLIRGLLRIAEMLDQDGGGSAKEKERLPERVEIGDSGASVL